MLLTLNSNFFRPFGILGEIEKSIEAGFRSIDLNLCLYNQNVLYFSERDHYIKEIKARLSEGGAVIHQTHAPFPSYREGEEDYNKLLKERTLQAIEVSAQLGAKQVIVHPIWFRNDTPAVQMEKNLELYEPYGKRAKECGIKIAIENIGIVSITSTPERLNKLFDTLNDPVFTVCFDVGHCLLQGVDPAEAIRAIGPRLVDGCTHVHDNNGDRDTHTLPYYGKVDWESVMKALADIDYQGDLNYEASAFIKDIPVALYYDGLTYMAKVGRYLIERFEYYKENK